jgi:hypothetical protein
MAEGPRPSISTGGFWTPEAATTVGLGFAAISSQEGAYLIASWTYPAAVVAMHL